jgi:hypothetical protein
VLVVLAENAELIRVDADEIVIRKSAWIDSNAVVENSVSAVASAA